MKTVLNSKFTIGDKVVDANNNIFIITDFLYLEIASKRSAKVLLERKYFLDRWIFYL